VADFALPDRLRVKGMGIGAAAAIKLVPALFIAYLLITRRFRAAAVASGTFAALGGLGFLLFPADSVRYWSGTFLDSERVTAVTGPAYTANQSLHGLAVRLTHGTAWGDPLWYLPAVLALVAGLFAARKAHRRGLHAYGMVLCAVTALLISPISWSHHWVWIAPGLLVLVDNVQRIPAARRPLAAWLPAGVLLVMFAWPLGTGGPRGLLWRVPNGQNRE
jgi:alpha-1,2-mannosyltransferase